MQFDTTVNLVGENPLPVYLGARQFTKPGGLAILCHTAETRPEAERVRDSLGIPVADLCPLSTAADVPELSRAMVAVRRAHPNAALNFTGGTKAMVAAAVMAWQNAPRDAFYLDDTRQTFFFAAERPNVALDGIVDLKLLCSLHGIKKLGPSGTPYLQPDELRGLFAAHRDRRLRTFAEFERNCTGDRGEQNKSMASWLKKNKQALEDLENYVDPATLADWRRVVDTPGQVGRAAGIFRMLSGRWLEFLIQDIIGALPDADLGTQLVCPDDLAVGQELRLATGRDFEGDVVATCRNRLRWTSCTTASYSRRVRDKSFEATLRARQLGGGMARSAVVCLGPRGVARDVMNAIDDKNHHVFCREDVDEWLRGITDSIREFMTE